MSEPTTRRLLQRQILPLSRDVDVIPLYVDTDEASLDADKESIGSNKSAQEMNRAASRQATGGGNALHPDAILDRTRLRVGAGKSLSLGTYFNGFAAGYWRRWTVVTEVNLAVTVTGQGAAVTVYRSMANGRSQRVDSGTVSGEQQTFSFDLTLTPFVDGGWYWYDVTAGEQDAVIESAEWTAEVPADRSDHGTVTIGITTMNRQDFCARLLSSLGEDEVLAPYLDRVLVMEQGSQLVADSDFFPHAQQALGDKLEVIVQGNIGGSGGFARAQYEALTREESTYALMLDDDVEAETESIVRAITFGDLARRPTIVGGHMFSLFAKSSLHSFGEIINKYRFWWMSPLSVQNDWDFSARNLRSSRWLHRRVDVDFNGWFMCLIPTQVIREIGLGLPLFIKWDDSEYGVRARAHGFPTVTLPGSAVWHVPWTDKNDALDWQAYFHQRNRFIAALLHSPFPKGGRMILESFNLQMKHLMSMQYSTVELRHQALEDVFAGPERLHAEIGTKLGQIREIRARYADAQLSGDPDAFPPPRREKPRKKLRTDDLPGTGKMLLMAGLGGVRQFRKPRALSRSHPEANVPAMDSKWYQLATLDSAVVSMPDGTSAAFYQRNPEMFREMLKRTVEIHERLLREWPALASRYREALGDLTSPESWAQTFADSVKEPR